MLVAGRHWMPNVAAVHVRLQGTQWNATGKTAAMTLGTAPFRTATATAPTSTSYLEGCRAVQSRNTGRRYFEITVAELGDSIWSAGVGTNTALVGNLGIGASDNQGACAYFEASSALFMLVAQASSEQSVVSGDPWANGDVLGFAADLSNRILWVSKNGVYYNGNPATPSPTGGLLWGSGTSATMFPFFQASVTAGTAAATINSGSSAFVGGLPTGYSAWGGT